MIEVPREQFLAIFRQQCQTGAVFEHANWRFEDGSSKTKWILILRIKQTSEKGLCWLLTSRFAKYNSRPRFQDRLFLIRKERAPFLERDSTIILDQVRQLDYQKLADKYIGADDERGNPGLSYQGCLEGNIMNEILAKIEDSRAIDDEVRQLLLNENPT